MRNAPYIKIRLLIVAAFALPAFVFINGCKELSKNNFYKLTCPDSMKGWMRTKLESQRSSSH
jgi:hypothetical protein